MASDHLSLAVDPWPRRASRMRPVWKGLRNAAAPGAAVLAVLATMQALVLAGVLPARSFPLVTDMLAAFVQEVKGLVFWQALAHTLGGWAGGLLIAVLTAVPLGIMLGSSRLLYAMARTVIEFLRPVPSVALIPLAVLVFGTGMQSKLFLVSFAAFWPLLVQTIYGVQDTDPVARDTARVFGLGPIATFFYVTLPGTLPFIATGFRVASATALILAVTAELVIGSPGLGALIETARSGGAIATAYAMIMATGLLGWGLNSISLLFQKRVLHWHPSHRMEVA